MQAVTRLVQGRWVKLGYTSWSSQIRPLPLRCPRVLCIAVVMPSVYTSLLDLLHRGPQVAAA